MKRTVVLEEWEYIPFSTEGVRLRVSGPLAVQHKWDQAVLHQIVIAT
jgi:hypothetical protein